MLEYKAYELGKFLVKADKFFPSTKQCSSCKGKREMELSERVYKCDYCGLVIDRDLNAALNLEEYGQNNWPKPVVEL